MATAMLILVDTCLYFSELLIVFSSDYVLFLHPREMLLLLSIILLLPAVNPSAASPTPIPTVITKTYHIMAIMREFG